MNTFNYSLEDIKSLLFFGKEIENPYFSFYPPSVKEVLEIGQIEFTKYLNVFIGKKDKSSFAELLERTTKNNTNYIETEKAIEFFCKEKPLFLTDVGLIVLGNPKNKRVINENLFSNLQEYVEIFLHLPPKVSAPLNEKPHEKKMREAKEKVEEAKRKKNEKENSAIEYSLLDMLSSISLEMKIPPNDLYECSYYYIVEQYERLRRKFNCNLTYQQLMAGAEAKKLDLKEWFYSRTKK